MHEAPHRLTPKTLRQTVEFLKQYRKHGGGIEKVDGDKIVGDQHFAELQVVFHPVAKQPAGERSAHPPRRNNAALSAAARRCELPRET